MLPQIILPQTRQLSLYRRNGQVLQQSATIEATYLGSFDDDPWSEGASRTGDCSKCRQSLSEAHELKWSILKGTLRPLTSAP